MAQGCGGPLSRRSGLHRLVRLHGLHWPRCGRGGGLLHGLHRPVRLHGLRLHGLLRRVTFARQPVAVVIMRVHEEDLLRLPCQRFDVEGRRSERRRYRDSGGVGRRRGEIWEGDRRLTIHVTPVAKYKALALIHLFSALCVIEGGRYISSLGGIIL